ncbi:MAG TPA: TlpA disulfide reductase family protein [Dokdonella sp.]
MLNRTNLLIVAVAVVGALAGFVAGGWLRPTPAPPPGVHAPKIGEVGAPVNLPDLSGRPRTLDEWKGKLVLLNFWASWCGPCREEMPLLDRGQQRHAAQGLQVVGVAVDTADAAKAFLDAAPVRYPILVDDPERAPDLSLAYGNTRSVLPYTVLLGADGRVLAQRFGRFTEASLETWLSPHLH